MPRAGDEKILAISNLLSPYSYSGEFHKSAKKVPSSPSILTPDCKPFYYGQIYPDHSIIINPFLIEAAGEIRVCAAGIARRSFVFPQNGI